MSELKLPLWITLAPLPVFTQSHRYKMYLTFKSDCKSLIALPNILRKDSKVVMYKYCFGSDYWQKYEVEVPKRLYDQRILLPGAINRNKIYSLTNKSEIVMFELINEANKCNIKIIENVNENLEMCTPGAAILIKDTFRGIPINHFKYNIKTEKLDVVVGPLHQYYRNSNLVRIRIKDKLLLFVSSKYVPYLFIQEYDIKNDFWQCLSNKLSKSFHIMSWTSILNGQMILISGTGQFPDKDTVILIYEIKTKRLKKSNIKFSMIGRNYLYAMNDKKMDILSINAWIKHQCRNSNIRWPECLKGIVINFFIKEFVHVINSNGEHCKIDVFKISNNCFNITE